MNTRSGNHVVEFAPASGSGSNRHLQASSPDTSPKSEEEETLKPGMIQCASYALELLSRGGLRSHVIGALVTDGDVQLLFYNRSICIVSEPLNFLAHQGRFISLLKAMNNLTLSQWGFVEKIFTTPPPFGEENPLDGVQVKLKDDTILKLGQTVFRQHCLIGRGTFVVRARRVKKGKGPDEEAWNRDLIVKLSWPSESRTPEHVIIEEACKLADNDEDRWVVKHLPKVLYHQDIEDCLLSKELIELMGDAYEKRVLRIIVQEELFSITERKTAAELARSLREIFRCIYSLSATFSNCSLSCCRLSMALREGKHHSSGHQHQQSDGSQGWRRCLRCFE
jgi:Fungal protein kinase